MTHLLSPSVRAFFADDSLLRERIAQRAARQAKLRKRTEDAAAILDMNDGYFVNPKQPAPPYEGRRGQQLSLDLNAKSGAEDEGTS